MEESKKQKDAAVILIGNEILSGRTQDKNLNYIANGLAGIGVKLAEVRVIPDVESVIIDTVNELRHKFDYVFTTGGIGPTHDDITSLAISKAFSVALIRDTHAVSMLEEYYKNKPEKLNEARLKMAEIPKDSELIDNPISSAPGFRKGNVYVFAGVPIIMQAMFDSIKDSLESGAIVISHSVTADAFEGDIAAGLNDLQQQYVDIDIGSYPHMLESGNFGLSVVMRGFDEKEISELEKMVKKLIMESGKNIIE